MKYTILVLCLFFITACIDTSEISDECKAYADEATSQCETRIEDLKEFIVNLVGGIYLGPQCNPPADPNNQNSMWDCDNVCNPQ